MLPDQVASIQGGRPCRMPAAPFLQPTLEKQNMKNADLKKALAAHLRNYELHMRKAKLLSSLASIVPAGQTVRDAVSEEKLQELFVKAGLELDDKGELYLVEDGKKKDNPALTEGGGGGKLWPDWRRLIEKTARSRTRMGIKLASVGSKIMRGQSIFGASKSSLATRSMILMTG